MTARLLRDGPLLDDPGAASATGMATWTGVEGKQILITGATSGIGLAAARTLAALGARLAIVARSRDKASRAVAEIQRSCRVEPQIDVLTADLSSQAAISRLAGEVLGRYRRLDVLVNNAGIARGARSLSEDGVELTWEVSEKQVERTAGMAGRPVSLPDVSAQDRE